MSKNLTIQPCKIRNCRVTQFGEFKKRSFNWNGKTVYTMRQDVFFQYDEGGDTRNIRLTLEDEEYNKFVDILQRALDGNVAVAVQWSPNPGSYTDKHTGEDKMWIGALIDNIHPLAELPEAKPVEVASGAIAEEYEEDDGLPF